MTEPTRVHIEIPADYEGIVTVELDVTKNGATQVAQQSEPLPPNSPAPEGEQA